MGFIEAIKIFCFGASYAVALGFEIWRFFRPRPILRYLSLGFGAAGLVAHTLYILVQQMPLSTASGSLLLIAWILAVFYFYGTMHHCKVAWGLFVLPLVLGLVILVGVSMRTSPQTSGNLIWQQSFSWRITHGWLLVLSGVGVSVGFVASVMYLVQAHRLKSKAPPGKGMKLLSLERLETMNRRAILLTFPLLTLGLSLGVILAIRENKPFIDLLDPKFLSVAGMWVVFAILLYLRYLAHARARLVAIWTIVAFGLMVVSLYAAHPFISGGVR